MLKVWILVYFSFFLKYVTSTSIRYYRDKVYRRPKNSYFDIWGDFSFKKVKKKIESSYFANIEETLTSKESIIPQILLNGERNELFEPTLSWRRGRFDTINFPEHVFFRTNGDNNYDNLQNISEEFWGEDSKRMKEIIETLLKSNFKINEKLNPQKNIFTDEEEAEKYRTSTTTSSIITKYPSTTATPKKSRKGKFESYHINQHGCEHYGGFHFEGDVWYSRGCRRHKCFHFDGTYFVETDSCDTEFFNTEYKCIIEANIHEDYPRCCPKYICNPDNLGNRVNVEDNFVRKA